MQARPFKKSTKTCFNHSESRGCLPEIPVTVKIRIGWDETSIDAMEIGHLVESVGAKALTIHGRTKVQGYRGDANWEVISEVADSIKIPVICNGSITSRQLHILRTNKLCWNYDWSCCSRLSLDF